MSVRELLDLLEKRASQPAAFKEAFSETALTACGIDINAKELSRLDAAILMHKYLLEIEGVQDLEDISGAEVLKDLYDCRKCVNHMAQVYLRGLIAPVRYPLPDGREILLFDGKGSMRSEDLACHPRE